MLAFKHTDGGRAEAGYGVKVDAGDCTVRAIALALDKPYEEAMQLCKSYGWTRAGRLSKAGIDKLLSDCGWQWAPYNAAKGEARVKLHTLSHRRCIARVSKHIVAVVDNCILDNHDPRRADTGGRCVYGIWEPVE